MSRAEIEEKYKEVIERRLSKFRNDEAQEFYTKTLPNRLEQFRANYTGAPEELEVATEDEEEERVLDFWDYLDDKTAEEKEKAIAEYAENDADYQPLASEIITDLQNENEKLKAELQAAQEEAEDYRENWEAVSNMRNALKIQIEIIDFALRIDDYKCLEMARNFVRAAYNQQPKESEEEQ